MDDTDNRDQKINQILDLTGIPSRDQARLKGQLTTFSDAELDRRLVRLHERGDRLAHWRQSRPKLKLVIT